VNAAAAIYVAVAHAKTVISHVVHHAIHRVDPDILPLRADFIGVNAVPTIPEIVLHEVNSGAVIIRQRPPETLLRPVAKRF
jgi:hypothetical protein